MEPVEPMDEQRSADSGFAPSMASHGPPEAEGEPETGSEAEPVDLTGLASELDRLSSELDAVEATLARLITDPAARCQVCGDEIDLDHLRSKPLATRCPGHAAQLQLRADFG